MTPKRIILYALVVFAISIMAAGPVFGVATEPFSDVSETNINADAINYLHGLAIVRGDDITGDFRPDDNLNRAEFAAILNRILGVEPDVDMYSGCFPDVASEWFARYVCHAKELGLVKGYAGGVLAGRYGAAEPLLNAEIVVMMGRVSGWGLTEDGEWYEPAWNYAVAHKIVGDMAYDAKTTRAQMAEIIFRTAVVKQYGLEEYTGEKGTKFMEEARDIVQAIDYLAETGMAMEIIPAELPDKEVWDEQTGVQLFSFSVRLPAEEDTAKLKGVRFRLDGVESTRNIGRLYMQDQTGATLFDKVLKPAEIPTPFIIMFDSPVTMTAGTEHSFTLYADFDYENRDPVRIYLSGPTDINTTATLSGDFPMYGPEITRDKEFYDIGEDPAKKEMCAGFDQEYNLPFPIQNGALDYEKAKPADPAGPVVLGEGAHAVIPIDQGNRGICAAAAVYSSLRWLEQMESLDIIENGTTGLEALVEAFYGGTETADQQDTKAEAYIESLNKCLSVEYDTQAGLNVACSELKAHKDKKCDIPLAFRCEKINPETGEVLTGADAEEWGHRVDLVDIVPDSSDSNQCTITYANSWRNNTNPGQDLDGLGSGRYERAVYNDDDESFDIEAPWGDQYKCKLRAAMYICVDYGKC